MIPFLFTFALWAILHSLTASHTVKDKVRRLVGEPLFNAFYRLAYNLFAIVTFIPVLYLAWRTLPARILWSVPSPLTYLFVLIQLIGIIGLVISLWQTDPLRFAGLRQAMTYGQDGDEPTQPELVIEGTYRLVRHPLYFFSLLLLWFMPMMTFNTFIFNLGATLYFWLGSIFEERKLAELFGEPYRLYQQRVPRLIPFTKSGGSNS